MSMDASDETQATAPGYSLTELADLAEVTPRTVRYYIQQGLVPSPGTTGAGTRYGEGHLDRLRLIKQLQRSHLPLAEIRSRLASVSEADVRALLEQASEPPEGTAVDYVRRVLGFRGMDRPSAVESMPRAMLRSPVAPSMAALREPSGEEVADRQALAAFIPPSAAPLPAPSARQLPAAAPGPLPAPAPDRSTWERIALAPDIELHVRRPLSRVQNRFLNRLMDFARKLMQEDQP
jgi:DNA-binding transcriptional MerR regulator